MEATESVCCRMRRTNRRTGHLVSLLDAEFPGSGFSAAGGRWVTFCEEHRIACYHQRYNVAVLFLCSPWDWCGACRAELGMEERG